MNEATRPRQVGEYFLPPKVAPRRGGMSLVYQGVDPEGNRLAVKLLTRNALTESSYDLIFARKRQVRLLDHPNVARLLASGFDSDLDQAYLVYPWVEHNLTSYIDANPQARPWPAFHSAFARPLTDALSHAHQRRVLHRDIKPGNILVTDGGVPLIADFGISKHMADLTPQPATVSGLRTDRYCPEAERYSYDTARDVYALAASFVDAMSEDRDFLADAFGEAAADLKLPAPIQRWLESCLEPDPRLRPDDGVRMLVELEQAVALSGTAERPSVHLELTRTATRMVEQALGLSADAVDTFVVDDLAGARLERPARRAPGEPDEYFLHGARLTYRLAEPRDHAAASGNAVAAVLIVRTARVLDDDQYDRVQNRAWQPPVRWEVGPPAARAAAVQTKQWLLRALDEQQEHQLAEEERRIEDRELAQWSSLLAAMDALEQVKEKPLAFDGSTVDGDRGRFRMTGELSSELLDQRRSVRIDEGRGPRVSGLIEAIDGRDLTMRFDEPVVRLPRRGQLVIDGGGNRSSIQQQRRAVNAVRYENGDLARPELRAIIIDPSVASPPLPVGPLLASIERLDPAKQSAVRRALGAPELFLVEGPPGTGKTSFIAEVVVQALAAVPDARVLLASQTNVALDNAIVRLQNAGVDRLVRLSSSEDKVAPEAQPLLMDGQVQQWAAKIRERAEQWMLERALLEGLAPEEYRCALALQELHRLVRDELELEANTSSLQSRLENDVDPSTGIVAERSDRQRWAADLESAQDKLAAARRRRRLFAGDQEAQLPSDAAMGDPAALELATTAALEEIFDATPALAALTALHVRWLERIQLSRGLEQALLQTRNVVAGTCVGFAGAPGMGDVDPFDLCIIDEASKATATQALVPMIRARKWILVGDPKQLPPMQEEVMRDAALMDRFQLDKDKLSETLFDRLLSAPKESQALLTTQHRMTRAIGDLVSNCFYGGRLETTNEDRLTAPLLERPVMWIDTSGAEGRQEQRSSIIGSHSKINTFESRLVRRFLAALQKHASQGLVAGAPADRPLDVLVLAPYVEQVHDLDRQRLELPDSPHVDIRVQTVDAVQGQEADVTVFSCTRSNPRGDVGFLGASEEGRINVALSRSRLGLVLIGDASFWSGRPVPLATVLRWIREEPEDCALIDLDRFGALADG